MIHRQGEIATYLARIDLDLEPMECFCIDDGTFPYRLPTTLTLSEYGEAGDGPPVPVLHGAGARDRVPRRGGPSGLTIAVRHADRVRRLGMVSAVSCREEPDRDGSPQAVSIDTLIGGNFVYWAANEALQPMLLKMLGIPPMAQRLPGTLFDQRSRIPGPLAARASVPTLVMHCEDDGLVPFSHGQHTHASIAGSRVGAYPTGGHLLAGNYEAARETVRAFLAEQKQAHRGGKTDAYGSDFLARLWRDGEAATEAASAAGIRVAHSRIPPVLGGAAIRGKIGRIGSGRQGCSRVSRDELACIIQHVPVADSTAHARRNGQCPGSRQPAGGTRVVPGPS